jgi:HEPN domain-containing protein
MKALAIGVTVGMLVVAGGPAWADETEMQKAQQLLQQARETLRTAKGEDFDGHRKRAVEHVNQALDEVAKALKVAKRDDRRDEKKVQQLEKKQDKIQKKIDKMGGD